MGGENLRQNTMDLERYGRSQSIHGHQLDQPCPLTRESEASQVSGSQQGGREWGRREGRRKKEEERDCGGDKERQEGRDRTEKEQRRRREGEENPHCEIPVTSHAPCATIASSMTRAHEDKVST